MGEVLVLGIKAQQYVKLTRQRYEMKRQRTISVIALIMWSPHQYCKKEGDGKYFCRRCTEITRQNTEQKLNHEKVIFRNNHHEMPVQLQ